MRVRLVSSIALACCFVCSWHWLAAEEAIKNSSNFAQEQAKPAVRSVSPDGKWEFRPGAAGEQDGFVIAKAGREQPSLVLSEEEYVDGLAEALGRAPGYANIVWATDSKRFAFNLQPGKGYQTAQFYQLDGDKWRKLGSVESHPDATAPLERSITREKKRLKEKLKLAPGDWGWPVMTSWQVRKWIDSNTVLLYAQRSAKFELNNNSKEVNVSFLFTLKFDPAGVWKITRKSEVPEKGVGGLNSEERKEIIRIEDQDRELRSK
jgi:hypothetical protein